MHRHVVPGDTVRFQTPLENDKRDAANAEQQRQIREDYARPDRRREQDVVRIYNESGVDLERGDIVALGDPVVEPSESLDSWYHRPAFKGQYPTYQPKWTGRIGIMLEPCAQEKVASAVVSGCVHAKVNVRDINHEYADVHPLDGGIRLTSNDAGSSCVQILSIEESSVPGGQCGTGAEDRWAYVRIQNGGQFTLVGKVTTAFAPFHCDGGLCPPKGKVQVYWLNPNTECLQQILDRQDNLIYVCPFNQECRPIPVDEWVRLHCDRWGTWWATPQEPVQAMLKALECIRPGDTDKTARVQKQGSAGYEDDPSYPDPVTVDNSDCLVYALTGELFMSRREGCCTTNWIPTGPYGLTRRVRIDTCIDCDSSGTATVLQSTCGGSGGGCGKTDADCTINVCNPSGRPIAPCGPEEAVAQLTPGVKDDAKDCCWYLQAGPYPTRAKATLSSALCPTDSTAAITAVTFPTYCAPDWPLPTSARNPYGLAGCLGAQVELVPDFTGCTCNWDIVMVQPQVRDLVHDLRANCSSACELQQQSFKNVLVWSCDDTVCQSPEWETWASGTTVDVMADLSSSCEGGSGCEGKGLNKSYARVCVLCAGEAPSDEVIPFTEQTFTRLVKVNEGSECSDCKIRYETITLCGLWCESATGDVVAYTANPVEVLTDVSIDCDGIHKTTQTAYVLCACDESESVSEANITTEVVAGDCIEVYKDEETCETTIHNTMAVTGGDGIRVSKSGCTYSISLDEGQGDPKTTLRVLCGVTISPITIACVETSGGWSFQVTGGEVTEEFTDITLPSSILSYTSDCGGSGGSGSGSGGGDPGIQFGAVDCTKYPNHIAFTFLGFPLGAVHYEIVVVGDQGSGLTIGPSETPDETVGQEYWGPLNENWLPAQPGECFTFTARFLDANGNVVSTQTFEDCCE